MNPFDRITIYFNGLSKAEKNTCTSILNNPEIIVNNSITDAAKLYNVSPSSIQRVAKKLGYKGYSEFKYSIEQYNAKKTQSKGQEKLSSQVFDAYSSTLLDWKNTIEEDKIIRLANLIKEKNVKTIGIGNSGLAASQLVYSLYMYGKWAESVNTTTKIAYLEYCVSENDLYIIFSMSGTLINANRVKAWKKKKATVVLITANDNAPIKKLVDLNIVIPILPVFINRTSNNILDNRTNFYVLIDILLLYYHSIK